jgi:hypothetical protein
MYLTLFLIRGEPISIDKIEEYATGLDFFYIRKMGGETVSFNRNNLERVERKLSNGRFKQLVLKDYKIKNKEFLVWSS